MSQPENSLSQSLDRIRDHVLAAGDQVLEAGWQDLAEALADIDVARAALALGRPEGWQRAQVLLSIDGPLHMLAELTGWEDDFSLAIGAAEPAIAAQ